MATTRPDGSPFTPDDREYWNQPYVYQEFPKMLYRRLRSGMAGSPAIAILQPEGTTKTPDGTVLEYLTVQSATEQTVAGCEGWADLPATMVR